MTEIERWRLERAELDRKIRKAETEEADRRARDVLNRLSADEELPVLQTIDQALVAVGITDNDRATQLIERLTVLVDAGRRRD